MYGAQALIKTLVDSGVEVCFANPGTSEMHLVTAIDTVPGMRPVLGLFEGVVTGMADGYARVAGKPAATLLHLGPGLANGLANLHNARRAQTPVVNIVGTTPPTTCSTTHRSPPTSSVSPDRCPPGCTPRPAPNPSVLMPHGPCTHRGRHPARSPH